MLHGSLAEPETYALLTVDSVWRRAFDWVLQLPADAPLGEVELQGREMFASIQEYPTLARHEARFESHQEHVDLQFTLFGGEAIEWMPRGQLGPDGPFANDVQFWLPPPDPITTLAQTAGRFAIFFPADAHRPKVRLTGHDRVRKGVIKIRRHLIH
ncbi:MAG TPA: YhcH/YjgK/YiaL family protein [Verrucomicrobiota bacterium]|nr:YhcH/YjgK/YiaL family protein [Verrucomicrobiota bacterium]